MVVERTARAAKPADSNRRAMDCGPFVVRPSLSYVTVVTGRRPSPQTVHTSRDDHPVMIRRGHSIGNAAKWSMPRPAGTVSGCVAIVQTEPGILPRGLRGRPANGPVID